MKKSKIVLSAAAAVTYAAADMYRFIFYRNRSRLSSFLFERKGHEAEYYYKRDYLADKLEQMPHEVMSMYSDRGYKLNGFYYRAGKERSKKIVYIVHGYRSNHSETAGFFADFYLSRGIDVFCDDHVASGYSEGGFIGYDFFETDDCLKWINNLKKHFGTDIQIILHGFSMGASTVAKMSEKCPDNVKFAVCDSGYTSAIDEFKSSFGIKAEFPFKVLNEFNKLIAGYDLYDTDVRNAVLNTRLPFLFVHGLEDKFVPFKMGKELFCICSSPDKRMLAVPDARHIEAMYRAPEEYAKNLDYFINKYIV